MAYKNIDDKRAYQRLYNKTTKAKATRLKWQRTKIGRAYKVRAMAARIARHQVWVSNIKIQSGCIDCGFNKWAEALDFDHKIDQHKTFNISQKLGYCKTVLAREIAKCEVRCANCHRHKTIVRGL